MAARQAEIESQLERLRNDLDLGFMHGQYWLQNEFLLLEQVLPRALVETFVAEACHLAADLNRRDIPGHKKGGSVDYMTLRDRAPAMCALYRSPTLRWILSRITESELLLCPEDDPHACALYYYTRTGDYMGFHYDRSYYRGRRYSAFVGLVERAHHCRLVARVRSDRCANEIRETRIPMTPGNLVVFNGDKLWHGVTPLAPGEERVVLALQYVTDQTIRPVNRLFSNLKDAFVRFGPAALMKGSPSMVGSRRRGA